MVVIQDSIYYEQKTKRRQGEGQLENHNGHRENSVWVEILEQDSTEQNGT